MAKRKSKKPQEEDTSILLESSVSQTKRRINSYNSPALLLIIIFTVGASTMGWFCVQQQQSLDQLSESFTTMQKRITSLQQVTDMKEEQTDGGFGVEDRIFALEEAQKQAQEKAEVALATSEKLKNSGHYEQLWALHDEMDTRLTEIKQVALSVTTLQAMFKNQSEEFEAVKESVVAGLSSGFALAETVARLSNAVASACSRVDEKVASVEALDARLEGQASDLKELKESMYLYNVALHANNQEMAVVKQLVEDKQAMRAQALEEMLSSVQTTLDEQFFTSQTLRSSVMAQLQTLHTRLANAPSMKLNSDEEGSAAEEFISTTTLNATEVQEKLEDAEEKDEQQDAEDEAEEEAEEEMQEEQSLEQEAEGGVIEEQEDEEITEEEEETTPEEQEDEEIAEEEDETTPEELEDDKMTEKEEETTTEEQEDEEITEEEDETTPEELEDKEITEQSEEQDVAAEVEVAEETVDGHVLDESKKKRRHSKKLRKAGRLERKSQLN
ncbi:FK506-binding protein 5 [Sebastes umbrosus]|uniref:FK506-binding protein 5 n=1 Tax=Sebastes umbrosus TaxID=72105 RepID=UPI00189D3391|nr:FK506-binding protein 5 [Sebastes umbrosus]